MLRNPHQSWMNRLLVVCLAWFATSTLSTVQAAEPETETSKERFLRIERDQREEPTALQTSVVRYSKPGEPEGVSVDLIGAVHIGDKAYYEQLNKLFESYDALLYELVAPEGTVVPKGGGPAATGNPVSAMQVSLKRMLDLEYQLEFVDYTRPNFVHADMSPEQLLETMRERGESVLQIFFKMMGQAIAMQSKDPTSSNDVKLLMALISPNRAVRLKRIMAEQFEDLDGQMLAFEGPGGSTIIGERNKRALEVLSRELSAGKKRIGIFYGAGHMPDMERRLKEEFGLEPVESRWMTAWSMSP